MSDQICMHCHDCAGSRLQGLPLEVLYQRAASIVSSRGGGTDLELHLLYFAPTAAVKSSQLTVYKKASNVEDLNLILLSTALIRFT